MPWPLCALMVWPTACQTFSICAVAPSLQRVYPALAFDVLTAGEIAHHLHSKRHGTFLCAPQERDDLRKRTRQERLREMRFGQNSGTATTSPFLHAASLLPHNTTPGASAAVHFG